MGFNSDVLAARGISKEEAWSRLGLELCAEDGNRTGTFKDVIQGFYMRPGWYILQFNKYGPTASDELLCSASESAEIMRLESCNSSNYSSASAWSEQRLVWQMNHHFYKSPTDLQVKGSPPEIFAPVKEAISKHYYSQNEESRWDMFFSIPTSIFALLTGFSTGRVPSKVGAPDFLVPSKDSLLSNLTTSANSESDEREDFFSQMRYEKKNPQAISEQEQEIDELLDAVWIRMDAYLYEQAISMLNEIQKNRPISIRAMWVHSECLGEMKKDSERKALLKQMTETEAQTKTDFYYRSKAWTACGFDESGAADYEKSKDEFGEIPLYLFGLG